MAEPAADHFDILLVGVGQRLLDLVLPELAPLVPRQLMTGKEIDGFLDNFQLQPGASILVSSDVTGMSHFEVAQAFNSYFQGLHIAFITLEREKMDVENLKKNGFSESFLLPLDQSILKSFIDDIKQKKSSGGLRRYRSVKLLDIEPGQQLPFPVRVFLPLNNKYALISAEGKVADKKIAKLRASNTNSVFVDADKIDKFYEFSAERLAALGAAGNDGVTETERSEKLKSSVRDLFRSVLSVGGEADFNKGRDLMEQSKRVVESFIKVKTGVDLRSQIGKLFGEGQESYSHAQLTSTMATLISLGTGIGKPEDIGIAGLFHDIGIQGLDRDVSIFEVDKLSPEEFKVYSQHPRQSLNYLREKKITVTPDIADIIERHHERIDGKGYPDKVQAHRIPDGAQILAYADAFEELTRKKPGQAAMTPKEVHQKIQSSLSLSAEILSKISAFLLA